MVRNDALVESGEEEKGEDEVDPEMGLGIRSVKGTDVPFLSPMPLM